jgi:methyl-accepting chemotaxis protein
VKPDKSSRQKGKNATDLWAGVAATAVFLLTASVLGIGWLTLCALLSALVYVGVRLLFPASSPTASEQPAVPSLSRETFLKELQEMDRRLPPALAVPLAQIVHQAEALLSYFKTHPQRSDPGLSLTGQYLRMAYDVTRRWLETLQSAADTAPRSTQKLEEFLTDISRRLSQLHQGLLQADDAHLAGEIEALTRTMKEMDEVYQRIGGENP